MVVSSCFVPIHVHSVLPLYWRMRSPCTPPASASCSDMSAAILVSLKPCICVVLFHVLTAWIKAWQQGLRPLGLHGRSVGKAQPSGLWRALSVGRLVMAQPKWSLWGSWLATFTCAPCGPRAVNREGVGKDKSTLRGRRATARLTSLTSSLQCLDMPEQRREVPEHRL